MISLSQNWLWMNSVAKFVPIQVLHCSPLFDVSQEFKILNVRTRYTSKIVDDNLVHGLANRHFNLDTSGLDWFE